jgi:hypothetical protein
MRYLLDQQSYQEMLSIAEHPRDCYVRGAEYLHHLYVDGVKFVVARALYECIKQATEAKDEEALLHLMFHKEDLERLIAESRNNGVDIRSVRNLGDPPPTDEEASPKIFNTFLPPFPATLEETGLNVTFVTEHLLRILYSKGRATGAELADTIKMGYGVIEPIIIEMRNGELIDIAGQRGYSDVNYEYILTPRGNAFAMDALTKTSYAGPAPVPLEEWIKSVKAQTIRNIHVTRRNIREAFADLIMDESILNMVGPAVNSGTSMMLFGYPGNGKTSIAERIANLLGDPIFIPMTIEADGSIIKMYDSIVHELPKEPIAEGTEYDLRWIRIKRPVVVVGGELTLEALDLIYNDKSKMYEAPFQMKANCGIFLVDDFGRQKVNPFYLLNRWIIPLEKKYDFITTITGQKMQIPFDQLTMFSTNLDPHQIGDDALLRRIKYKFEVIDPTESQWRAIWKIMCKIRKVPYDDRGLDYLVARWFKPENRPFRMCQPRDIIDQMISIAAYNMETVTLNPDLLDAACLTYFPDKEQKQFGAKVKLDM